MLDDNEIFIEKKSPKKIVFVFSWSRVYINDDGIFELKKI